MTHNKKVEQFIGNSIGFSVYVKDTMYTYPNA